MFITSVIGAFFLPALAPATALYAEAVGGGAIGGGTIGGVGGFLHGKKVNKGECKKLRDEGRELKSRLKTLKTGFAAKRPSIVAVEKQLNVN